MVEHSADSDVSDTLYYIAFGMAGVIGTVVADGVALIAISIFAILAFPIYAIFSNINELDDALGPALLAIPEAILMFIIYVLFRHHDYAVLGHMANFFIDLIGWLVILAILFFAGLYIHDKYKGIS